MWSDLRVNSNGIKKILEIYYVGNPGQYLTYWAITELNRLASNAYWTWIICYILNWLYILYLNIMFGICWVPHWVATHIKRKIFPGISRLAFEPICRLVDTRRQQRSGCRNHSLSPSHILYRMLEDEILSVHHVLY